MTPAAIYNVLAAESTSICWPVAYANDLHVHDLNFLIETGTQHFIWVLRESGTHLYPLDTNDTRYTKSCLRAVNLLNKEAMYYVFTAGKLQSKTFEEVLKIA